MSAAIAAVAVGAGVSAYGAYSSNKASGDAAKKQSRLMKQQLQFDMKVYEDWQRIYGGIEENLSNYYKDLSPDRVAAVDINSIQESYAASKENIIREFKQRGFDTSGLEGAALTNLESNRANVSAAARAGAEQKVMSAQTQFLAAGKGGQALATNGLNNTYTNQAGIYGNQAQLAGQGVAAGLQGVTQSLNNYAYMNLNTPQTPEITQWQPAGNSGVSGGGSTQIPGWGN